MNIKQGADKTFSFFVYNWNGEIVKEKPANVVFTAVRRIECANCQKIEKKLGNGIEFDQASGKYRIIFYPEDTIGLETGVYPFDIKIKRANRQYFIVKSGALKIVKSYTGVI